MVKFKILVPEATVNYITNPSLRYDTTGWNAQGSAISRVLTRARFGIASLQVVSNGAALHEGASFRVSSLTGVNEQITVSAYVRGEGVVRIRLDNNVVGGDEWSSDGIQLSDEHWTRVEVSGFNTGGDDLRLYVETDEDAAVVRTFYLDGAQMERKGYSTTYCDGDQDGCSWNGLYHGSTSMRLASTRAGGRWIQIAGEEREENDLYMTVVGGMGMPPLINNTQSFALADGGYFQNHKTNMRLTTFTFHAKHHVDDRDDPVSLAHLHELRQVLINLVKPDLTGGDEEILCAYDDGTTVLYFKARYDGGLEGDWDIRNQFVNSFPLRLFSTSPYFTEDSQEVQELDFQDTLQTNYVAARFNGKWNNMNWGFNSKLTYRKPLVFSPRGLLFAVGYTTGVTVANNNAAAVDPLLAVKYLTYWDGTQWHAIATTTVDNQIQCVAVAPNGTDLYVGGGFTNIGGVAANRIAKYDTLTGTFSALGSGLSGLCADIQIAANGDVYVGGSFNQAGGMTAASIARWDGSSWHRLGQYGGLNGNVASIAIKPDGTELYVGGAFTDEYTSPGTGLAHVAKYNVASGLFSAMGSGLDATVTDVQLSPFNGLIYAIGIFTGGVAKFDGNTWIVLGDGLDTNIFVTSHNLTFLSNGDLIAFGLFSASGSIPLKDVAVWNGSTWTNLDIDIPVDSSGFVAGVADRYDNLFLAYAQNSSPDNTRVSGITTVNNPGSRACSPVIYVKGPGTLRWIENQTTQKRLYLNMGVLDGEEVFFDFGRGTIESTVRGSLYFAMFSGSDFRSFRLAPGDNTLACFMVDDVNAFMSIQLVPSHWSADATQTWVDL